MQLSLLQNIPSDQQEETVTFKQAHLCKFGNSFGGRGAIWQGKVGLFVGD